MFLCIEELTWNEAMNVTRVFYWNPGRVMFHLGSHFVSRDFFIPYSGFYVRGPKFCEFCKSELTSQILML